MGLWACCWMGLCHLEARAEAPTIFLKIEAEAPVRHRLDDFLPKNLKLANTILIPFEEGKGEFPILHVHIAEWPLLIRAQGLQLVNSPFAKRTSVHSGCYGVAVSGWVQDHEASSQAKRVYISSGAFRGDKVEGLESQRVVLALARRVVAGYLGFKEALSPSAWTPAPLPDPSVSQVDATLMKVDGSAPPLDYPWEARIARANGLATLSLVVDQSGKVVRAEVLEAPPEVALSALNYVMMLKFKIPSACKNMTLMEFNLSLPYGLPEVCNTSRLVLDVVGGWNRERSLQPDLEEVKGFIRKLMESEGVQIVDVPPELDKDLRYLKIEVNTDRIDKDVCLFELKARLSRWVDRNREDRPGLPASLAVHDGVVVAQRGEAGFRDSILNGVSELVSVLTNPPHPKASAVGADWSEKLSRMVETDYKQLAVKSRPPVPQYPIGAIFGRVQGDVIIDLEVDETGRPIHGRVRQAPLDLMSTALSYALRWTFEPAQVNGKPVKTQFRLTMPFRLR